MNYRFPPPFKGLVFQHDGESLSPLVTTHQTFCDRCSYSCGKHSIPLDTQQIYLQCFDCIWCHPPAWNDQELRSWGFRVAQWSKALHHISVLAVPLENLGLRPGSVAAGHDWETHGVAHNWPNIVRVKGRVWSAWMFLSHYVLATPMTGRAQCKLTRSPGVR